MEYEGQIKLNAHGTTQWVWVYVRAQSVEFARARAYCGSIIRAKGARP